MTNWIARMGFVSNFTFTTACKYCVIKPTYSAASHGGRGAVVFAKGNCALYPSANCNLRTVFLVTKVGTGGLYLFGRNGLDLSFRVTSSAIYLHGQYNFNPVGALFHINGIDYTDTSATTVAMPSNPLLITGGAEAWQCDLSNYHDVRWTLGCNFNSNAMPQEMAEIICYTERLTEAQIVRVEDYLMKKWGLKGGEVQSYADVFAEGAELTMAGTGVLDAQGAALSVATLNSAGGSIRNFSSLTVTDGITLDVVKGIVSPLTLYGDVTFGTAGNGHDIPVTVDDWRTLDDGQPSYQAVSVQSADGVTPPTVTGQLHPAEKMNSWALTRSGSSWSISRTGLVIIFH